MAKEDKIPKVPEVQAPVAPPIPEPETKEPEYSFDVAEYILSGYVEETFKKKHFSFTLRTLLQDEAIEILARAASASIASKAHADAVLTAMTVGASLMGINGGKLSNRKDHKTVEEYLDSRFTYAKSLSVILLDTMNADFAALNYKVQEFLREPEEAVKN